MPDINMTPTCCSKSKDMRRIIMSYNVIAVHGVRVFGWPPLWHSGDLKFTPKTEPLIPTHKNPCVWFRSVVGMGWFDVGSVLDLGVGVTFTFVSVRSGFGG